MRCDCFPFGMGDGERTCSGLVLETQDPGQTSNRNQIILYCTQNTFVESLWCLVAMSADSSRVRVSRDSCMCRCHTSVSVSVRTHGSFHCTRRQCVLLLPFHGHMQSKWSQRNLVACVRFTGAEFPMGQNIFRRGSRNSVANRTSGPQNTYQHKRDLKSWSIPFRAT